MKIRLAFEKALEEESWISLGTSLHPVPALGPGCVQEGARLEFWECPPVGLGLCLAIFVEELFFLREKKMRESCLCSSPIAVFHLQGLPGGWAYEEDTVVFPRAKGRPG